MRPGRSNWQPHARHKRLHCGLMRPKTITQIAMGQLLEGADVHVDVMGEQKQLWSRADKREVLDMMAEVKSAVEASLERLEAELPTNSLYVCLEVFDIAAWESLLGAARRSDSDASLKAKFKEMRRKWRRLFEALGWCVMHKPLFQPCNLRWHVLPACRTPRPSACETEPAGQRPWRQRRAPRLHTAP